MRGPGASLAIESKRHGVRGVLLWWREAMLGKDILSLPLGEKLMLSRVTNSTLCVGFFFSRKCAEIALVNDRF